MFQAIINKFFTPSVDSLINAQAVLAAKLRKVEATHSARALAVDEQIIAMQKQRDAHDIESDRAATIAFKLERIFKL